MCICSGKPPHTFLTRPSVQWKIFHDGEQNLIEVKLRIKQGNCYEPSGCYIEKFTKFWILLTGKIQAHRDYINNLTCFDGSGGLEKAKLSLVASWDTAFTAWSEGKGDMVTYGGDVMVICCVCLVKENGVTALNIRRCNF